MKTPHSRPRQPTGFSLIGLLVTMACIIVLFSVYMTSVNKAVTGEGSVKDGTVRSMQDEIRLYGLFQSMAAGAQDYRGRFIAPSVVNGKGDIAYDTTANLFSAMIAQNYTTTEDVISANEYSPFVTEDFDYDPVAYQPLHEQYWDPDFKADLKRGSNVSFAHLPLYGPRRDRAWVFNARADVPILGTRGPKDGVEDPESYTYGRDGTWAGHYVLGDGSVHFVDTFTPNGMTCEIDGRHERDNLFHMDEGRDGDDAILAFTRIMRTDGPELQFD